MQLGAVTPGELVALAKAALRDGWQPTEGGPDGGRRDSIRSIKRKIAKLVEAARGASSNTVPPLARASRSLIDRAAKVSLDLTDYDHVIDESAIRYILNRHSDPKVERDHNQFPVTPEAFQHIPDVIASPMRFVFGTKTNTGLEQVAYLGRLPDGKMLYLEEVRTGRRHLATKTLRVFCYGSCRRHHRQPWPRRPKRQHCSQCTAGGPQIQPCGPARQRSRRAPEAHRARAHLEPADVGDARRQQGRLWPAVHDAAAPARAGDPRFPSGCHRVDL